MLTGALGGSIGRRSNSPWYERLHGETTTRLRLGRSRDPAAGQRRSAQWALVSGFLTVTSASSRQASATGAQAVDQAFVGPRLKQVLGNVVHVRDISEGRVVEQGHWDMRSIIVFQVVQRPVFVSEARVGVVTFRKQVARPFLEPCGYRVVFSTRHHGSDPDALRLRPGRCSTHPTRAQSAKHQSDAMPTCLCKSSEQHIYVTQAACQKTRNLSKPRLRIHQYPTRLQGFSDRLQQRHTRMRVVGWRTCVAYSRKLVD